MPRYAVNVSCHTLCHPQDGNPRTLTNVVFMGMGEPLHNPDAVLAAATIMSHPLGLQLSHNKITVRTGRCCADLNGVVDYGRCAAMLLQRIVLLIIAVHLYQFC